METASNLFIGNAPKGSCTALPEKAGGRELSLSILHQIAVTNESFTQATARLIRLCELAYGRRDDEALEAITAALEAVPFQPAQRAATYYRAVLHTRAGQLDQAAELLATVTAPRALLTLGTVEEYRGNIAEAARLHLEAMRAGQGVDLFTVAGARMQLATIRAAEGDHAGALYDLRSAAPLVRLAAQSHPALYAIWHNALAVELCEAGHRDEARAALAVALASPVAPAYPEFEETADELRQVERVAIVVAKPKREEKRRQAACHLSLASNQWPVASGRRPARRSLFRFTRYARTNPRAPTRAPPSPFISTAN